MDQLKIDLYYFRLNDKPTDMEWSIEDLNSNYRVLSVEVVMEIATEWKRGKGGLLGGEWEMCHY